MASCVRLHAACMLFRMATLPEFIERIGDNAAAELFGVKVRTIESWRRRERFPRVEQARVIVTRTRNEVDYAGIFGADEQEAA